MGMASGQSNNVLLFRLAVSNGFERIANSVSEEEFLKILTVLQEHPGRARKLHKAMIKELHESMSADFEDILCEGSLERALAKVSKLSENADSAVENAWRPPGDVALHLRSLDAGKILEETGSLEGRVAALEEENEKLTRKIAGKRATLVAAHETAARSLNQSPAAVQRLQLRIEQLEKCLKLLQKDWENR